MSSPVCPQAFATLSPENTLARQGFDAVAIRSNAKSDVKLSQYTRMYIAKATAVYPPAQLSESDSDYDTTQSKGDALHYGGHYALCLCRRHKPRHPGLGWIMGYGDPRLPDAGVDLQLDDRRRKPTLLRPRHARFVFTSDGLFALTVVKDGRGIIVGSDSFTTGLRLLPHAKPTAIQLGEFSYTLRLTAIVQTPAWLDDYRIYMEESGLHPTPDFVTPTPSPLDHLLGDWVISNTISSGSSGAVSTAKNLKKGKLFAAKRYKAGGNRGNSSTEIQMLRSLLPKHKNIIQYVDHISEENKNGWAYLFMTPLALCTLSEMREHNAEACLSVMDQLLQGLQALHVAGIVHRDIKPLNIGIARVDPLLIFIFDFDHACQPRGRQKILPMPGKFGTRSYLAPEMEEVPYDFKVDIWSCGKIGAWILFGRGNALWNDILCITHTPQIRSVSDLPTKGYQLPRALLPAETNNLGSLWTSDTRLSARQQNKRVHEVLPELNGAAPNSIEHLVGQLLECDPDLRPSADDALLHHCFRESAFLPPTHKTGDKRHFEHNNIHTSLEPSESGSTAEMAGTNRLTAWERKPATHAHLGRHALRVGGGSEDYFELET